MRKRGWLIRTGDRLEQSLLALLSEFALSACASILALPKTSNFAHARTFGSGMGSHPVGDKTKDHQL